MEQQQEYHILSFGGGVNSVALLLHLLQNEKPLDEIIFADTGGELPETYQYLEYIKRVLLNKNIPSTIVEAKNDNLYERCKRRKVIPSQIWRWCTRDLKIRPIYSYYRSLDAHVNQYLGISYEEKKRIKDSGTKYVTNVYPLVEEKIDRIECLDIINKANLKLPVRSGCYFCPFNSVSRWTEIYKNHKNLFRKALELEESSKHFPKQRLNKFTLRNFKEMIDSQEPIPNITINRLCGSECVL
jgi:hypothetical protein